MTYVNPRNSTRDRVNRRARQLEAEGRLTPRYLNAPGHGYTRAEGDILVEIVKDGVRRTQGEALAQRRDAGAVFKRQLARYFVFGVQR